MKRVGKKMVSLNHRSGTRSDEEVRGIVMATIFVHIVSIQGEHEDAKQCKRALMSVNLTCLGAAVTKEEKNKRANPWPRMTELAPKSAMKLSR